MFNPIKQFEEIPDYSLAIFIAKTSRGNNHTGILIKNNNEIKFYHLAWHLQFECELWESLLKDELYVTKRWVRFEYLNSDPVMYEFRLPSIIKFLEFIYTENANKIPYGVNYSKTRFTEDGDLVLGENECGLTCATFISCYFESVGISLVDLSTWISRDEDEAWKRFVIGIMMITNVPESHIANVEKEEINFRLKPEEIAVASSRSGTELPADFSFCSTNGAVFNTFPRDD